MRLSLLKKYSKKKFIRNTIIVLFALGLCLLNYGNKTRYYIKSYRLYGDFWSQSKIIPERREVAITHGQSGTSFVAYGVGMVLPWKYMMWKSNLFNDTLKDSDAVQFIRFGQEVLVSITNPNLATPTIYQLYLKSTDPADKLKFSRVFSNRFSSNFHFIKSSLFATPDIFEIFTSTRWESLLKFHQLNTKWMYIRSIKNLEKIYYFETETCKGFQVGEPSINKYTSLYIFPNSGQEFELSISCREIGRVTQKDVDMIITSFHKIS
jgi:hypothetical protein